MNLIWFLTIATVLTTVLGEFGQFPFGSPMSVSITDILLTLVLGLFLVWKIAIQKEHFWPEEFKLLTIFWLVAFAGLIFSRNLQGGLYLIKFMVYSSSFLIGYFLVKERKIKPIDIFRIFGLSGLVFVIFGFLQLLFFPNFEQLSLLGYDPHQNRLTSTFLDPNFAAAFLVLVFFVTSFLYRNSKRREWLVAGVLESIGLGLTFSRSGYLMFAVIILLLGILKNRKLLLLFIPLVILVSVIPQISDRILGGLTLDPSAKARFLSWQNGLFLFSTNPILGVGFDNLRQAFSKYNLFQTYSANGGNSGSGIDSSLIFILSTTGLVGFLTYFFWWIKILKKIPLSISCVFIGLIIDSQFINSLFYPPIMLYIFLISGSLSASQKNNL